MSVLLSCSLVKVCDPTQPCVCLHAWVMCVFRVCFGGHECARVYPSVRLSSSVLRGLMGLTSCLISNLPQSGGDGEKESERQRVRALWECVWEWQRYKRCFSERKKVKVRKWNNVQVKYIDLCRIVWTCIHHQTLCYHRNTLMMQQDIQWLAAFLLYSILKKTVSNFIKILMFWIVMSQNILYFSNIPIKSELWTFLYFIIL